MSDARNIVILGAGFAGLNAAHYFMRHIYPSLKRTDAHASYKLIIIDQSTHFWWHIAAPREIVSTKLMSHNKTFFPLLDGFKQYGKDQDIIEFHQAQPTFVDTKSRLVTIKNVSKDANADANNPAHTQSIPYYALIIATGTMTPTPTTSFHGDHQKTQAALEEMNKRLSRASSVIVAGGGPVAVETAGEVGQALNGTKPNLSSPKVKVTVVAGGEKLLPVLGQKYSDKASKFLSKVGVNVVYNARVSKVEFGVSEAEKTTVVLSNSDVMTADVYIPATGVTPNTNFLPKELLNDRRYVQTNPSTLRVDGAGDRVYALGDVGSYTRGGVLDINAATPVLGRNLAADLGVRAPNSSDKAHKPDTSETQIVPVGTVGGVGAFKGFGLPSFIVKQAKGKDYMLKMIPNTTQGKRSRCRSMIRLVSNT